MPVLSVLQMLFSFLSFTQLSLWHPKMWKECIFVFDTSVLLNIYRYTPETREDFFRLLEKLKKRIWIPHQVALEYLEQRENVISQQQVIYNDIDEIKTFFQRNILNKYKRGHPFANIEEIKKILEDAIEKAKGALREAQSKSPDLLEEDVHLDRIIQLFGDNVGSPFPKSTLNKIYEEAQQRYKEKVPPGYEDEKNKEHPYGDLVLWYQLIDHANSQKKPIIFVIDDAKGDWWRQHKDKKEEILGPRPELIEEVHTKANISFYMYLADEFIKQAPTFLDVQINPETVREVREVRQRAEDAEALPKLYERIMAYLNEPKPVQAHRKLDFVQWNILLSYLSKLNERDAAYTILQSLLESMSEDTNSESNNITDTSINEEPDQNSDNFSG